MFVAGRRAQRARTPNTGYYRADGRFPQLKPFVLKFRGGDIRQDWAARGDVEVVTLSAWQDIRATIASVDPAAHTAQVNVNAPPEATRADARYWIENAPDGLDQPGEWRLDGPTKTVYYWPLSGEDLTQDEVIAPVLTQLVRLEGAEDNGKLVRDVAFRRLDFRGTDWTMGPQGYADRQAASDIPAAFDAQGAENITIENCSFSELGGYAISFGQACRRNRIAANEIFDTGAGGIRIGEPLSGHQRAETAARNGENTITDNHLHNLGLIYPGAVGVLILQSSQNLVAHNHIHDLPYTAISVGWTWGYAPVGIHDNRIEYNHLHDIGKGMMSDMGGIYTLGIQPGTVLRNNLIHDVDDFLYGGWGIYLDEGTSNVLVENNVVYHCRSAGFNQHYGRDNVVRNNIFAFNREYQMTRSRPEPHLSFTFERNIVYFDSGHLLGTNWNGGVKLDRNIYWDARGIPINPAGHSWSEWQQSGQDKESKIADPLFVNPANFNFALQPGSPARSLGIQPIDLSTVGPRGKVGP
jgi:parallel beta-helix repeat protein